MHKKLHLACNNYPCNSSHIKCMWHEAPILKDVDMMYTLNKNKLQNYQCQCLSMIVPTNLISQRLSSLIWTVKLYLLHRLGEGSCVSESLSSVFFHLLFARFCRLDHTIQMWLGLKRRTDFCSAVPLTEHTFWQIGFKDSKRT